MIKLLFAIPELDKAGPDRVFFEIISALDYKEYEVYLITTSDKGFYYYEVSSKVNKVVINRPFRFWNRYPADGLFYQIKKIKPDIVITTLRMNATLNIIYPFLSKRTKFITRLANDVSANGAEVSKAGFKQKIAIKLNKLLVKKTDAIIAQSHHMADDIRSSIPSCPQVKVLYNPISENYLDLKVRPGNMNSSLEGIPSLISVGRLMPQKGFDVLIEAMVEVKKVFKDVHLTILGEGHERQALESLIKKNSLEGIVSLSGFSTDPLPMIEQASLFVLASRYEGFSNATLESLAIGTPVVVTNSPGANSEIISDGENGFLCELENSQDLALKIIKALQSNWDPLTIRSTTFARFGSDKIVAEYSDFFKSLIKS